jgi:hypothetical protein
MVISQENAAEYDKNATGTRAELDGHRLQEDSIDASIPSSGAAPKKRKKKRAKKKTEPEASKSVQLSDGAPKSPVLCISRNKHWRYISSYHVRFLSCHLLPFLPLTASSFRALGYSCL